MINKPSKTNHEENKWNSLKNFILSNNEKSFNKTINKFNDYKRKKMAKDLLTSPDGHLAQTLMQLKRRSRQIMQLRRKSRHSSCLNNSSSKHNSIIQNAKSTPLSTHDDMQTEKRKTLAMYKKYSRLFPLNTLQVTPVPDRSCQSRIENPSSLLEPNRPRNSVANLDFTISVMKAENVRDRESDTSSNNSNESDIDPTILLAGQRYDKLGTMMSSKSVIPHYSEVGQTDSLERVSNCSFSSTSSKVSVNSKFMDVVRFSLKSNLNRYTKIYNKYNHGVEPKYAKRKSKSHQNLCVFSRNLCRILRKKTRRARPKASRCASKNAQGRNKYRGNTVRPLSSRKRIDHSKVLISNNSGSVSNTESSAQGTTKKNTPLVERNKNPDFRIKARKSQFRPTSLVPSTIQPSKIGIKTPLVISPPCFSPGVSTALSPQVPLSGSAYTFQSSGLKLNVKEKALGQPLNLSFRSKRTPQKRDTDMTSKLSTIRSITQNTEDKKESMPKFIKDQKFLKNKFVRDKNLTFIGSSKDIEKPAKNITLTLDKEKQGNIRLLLTNLRRKKLEEAASHNDRPSIPMKVHERRLTSVDRSRQDQRKFQPSSIRPFSPLNDTNMRVRSPMFADRAMSPLFQTNDQKSPTKYLKRRTLAKPSRMKPNSKKVPKVGSSKRKTKVQFKDARLESCYSPLLPEGRTIEEMIDTGSKYIRRKTKRSIRSPLGTRVALNNIFDQENTISKLGNGRRSPSKIKHKIDFHSKTITEDDERTNNLLRELMEKKNLFKNQKHSIGHDTYEVIREEICGKLIDQHKGASSMIPRSTMMVRPFSPTLRDLPGFNISNPNVKKDLVEDVSESTKPDYLNMMLKRPTYKFN